jgi:uncharacterized membrane protein (UPF0136 family)
MSPQNWDDLLSGTAYRGVKILTRTAMPCLLIVFGFMFEYVYAKRWAAQGGSVVFKRMASRAILCYLAYLILALAGFLADHHSFKHFIKSALFLSPAMHANIFKYYASLIPIIFALMWLQFRFGFVYVVAIVVVTVIVAEFLGIYITSVPKIFGHIGALFFGIGDSWGPSISHALLMVIFGMSVAYYLRNRQISLPAVVVIVFTIASIYILVNEINSIGLGEFVLRIVNIKSYRQNNSFVYFAYGIIAFLIFWQVSLVIVKMFSNYLNNRVSLYGGNTFTMFFYGNLFVLLTPDFSRQVSFPVSIAGLILTLIVAFLSVNVIERLNGNYQLLSIYESIIEKLLFKFSSKNEVDSLDPQPVVQSSN